MYLICFYMDRNIPVISLIGNVTYCVYMHTERREYYYHFIHDKY